MSLYRIDDFPPERLRAGQQQRRQAGQGLFFDGRDLERDLKGVDVYSAEGRNMGSVVDLLVDDTGHPQYLVVRRSRSGKQVLVPTSQCTDVPNENRIHARTLNRNEFGTLPEYDDSQPLEAGQAREMYQMMPLEQSLPVEATLAGGAVTAVVSEQAVTEPIPEAAVQPQSSGERPIQLYEERLVTQKQRVKTGEIKISKRTVTESVEAAVPITREKVIIEIESIYGGETRVDFGDAQVDEDGAMRMGIYEEQAEVCRRIVPYQNVSVRKEIVQDVVRAQETLRREELDVQTEGAPYVEINSEIDSSVEP